MILRRFLDICPPQTTNTTTVDPWRRMKLILKGPDDLYVGSTMEFRKLMCNCYIIGSGLIVDCTYNLSLRGPHGPYIFYHIW